MAKVSLRFAPAAEHVRTARLVAVAVARRSGLPELRLDEVRLAVGEMCARAVLRCESGPGASTDDGWSVHVELDDSGAGIDVRVTDPAGSAEVDGEQLSMALVRDLADEVEVSAGPGGAGGSVLLRWAGLPAGLLDDLGGDSLGDDSFGGDSFGGDSLGGDSLGGDSLGGVSLGGDSLGGGSLGGDSLGGGSLGGVSLGDDRSRAVGGDGLAPEDARTSPDPGESGSSPGGTSNVSPT